MYGRKPEEIDHFEEVSLDGGVIFKRILKK
jgi:hypothetical protein